jgi:hypothetical protein
MQPLPHPPSAEFDDRSVEVLRAWVIDGGLEIAIHPSHWAKQADQWGRLLADAAQHMADAISEQTGRERSEVFRSPIHSTTAYSTRHMTATGPSCREPTRSTY